MDTIRRSHLELRPRCLSTSTLMPGEVDGTLDLPSSRTAAGVTATERCDFACGVLLRFACVSVDRVALVAQIARIEIVECIPSQPVGRYGAAMAKTGLDVPGPGTCPTEEQIPQLLAFTRDEDPKVRRLALKHLCPCRLQRQRDAVWARVFELTKDRDPGVRRDAVHAMTDGSPREYAEVVQSHLESMRRDPDPRVRKYVNRTLAAIWRTGRVNVN